MILVKKSAKCSISWCDAVRENSSLTQTTAFSTNPTKTFIFWIIYFNSWKIIIVEDHNNNRASYYDLTLKVKFLKNAKILRSVKYNFFHFLG